MADFTRVKRKVMNILNVDAGYGTFNTNDPRFQQGLIDDTIKQSDLKVVQAILVSNNLLRLQYLQPISIADKQPLPFSVGPYGPVIITRAPTLGPIKRRPWRRRRALKRL